MDDISRIGSKRTWSGKSVVPANTLPFAQLSFAHSGEDIVLGNFFKLKIGSDDPGVYVDVGCAAPIVNSNTYYFYCRNWRGVCIDLHPKCGALWRALRPEDVYVNAAVSDERRDAFVYYHAKYDGMTRIGFDNVPPAQDFVLGGVVPSRPLAEILTEELPAGTPIDFFSIDVEGAEMGVLRSNDWNQWRPRVIMAECWTKSGRTVELVNYLKSLDYAHVGQHGDNLIFLSA